MNIPDLVSGELTASGARDGDSVRLSFSGNADARVDRELEAFLGKVHAEILRDPASEVIVDIRALEFMNSSCFKGFITWIVQVRRMDPKSRYRIRFLSTSKHPWQKRSLHAISYFGGELIVIESDN
ncbi:MAG: hypothetical protein KC420_16755 [Myxococcales bacterium]|nr:hypothetical protein [Myxococcales bacterium]MCB9701774.1 hypothetical protein [Myxococcales bacterium]